MLAIRGHYDGRVVILDGPAPVPSEAEVLVLFRQQPALSPEEAKAVRQRLRGSARGMHLLDKLLRERQRDG
jgi:hypothetical protein